MNTQKWSITDLNCDLLGLLTIIPIICVFIPNIIRTIKSRWTRLAGYVTFVGEGYI